ncbi:ribosomal protein S5 [Rhizina undulata]
MASNEVDTDGAKDGTHDNGSLKLFEMWTTHDVKVTDNLLRKYIQIRNSDDDLPSSNHPYARPVSRFRKTHCPIVELLAGSFLINRNSGNEIKGLRIVDHAFRIINYRTNQNPIQVLVDAIVNCAPRELDSTSAYPLGTVRHQAVGVLPREWVDHAINLLIIGAFELSPFRNVKNEGECLADELINTANGSSSSHALEMRDELERYVFLIWQKKKLLLI